MDYGILLPVQAQSILIRQEWETTAGPDELAFVARACDEAGLDVVGVCDHVAIPAELAATTGTTWYDTVATLSWVAAITSRVRLMSMVHVLPYRHPLVTAKAFATLDTLSGGRAVLGVGVGHVEGEFEALGLDFAQRGRQTDRAIEVIRRFFRDEFGEQGTHGQRPRPVQPGGPPIWVGGSSAAALRRAATVGDGWLPQGPPPGGMAVAVEELRGLCAASGRDVTSLGVGGGLSCYIGDPPADVPEWVVAGSADRLASAVDELGAIGVTFVQLRFESRDHEELADQVRTFMAEVAPLVG